MKTWVEVYGRMVRMEPVQTLHLTRLEMHAIAEDSIRVFGSSDYMRGWVERFLAGEVRTNGVRVQECPGVKVGNEEEGLA